jgi:hypothetical protein
MRTLFCGLAALMVAPCALAAGAEADEFVSSRNQAIPAIDYVARAGLSYTDNVFRSPPGTEVSSGAFAVGVMANGERDTGRLTYQTAVDLSYNAYFDDIDGEVFGGASVSGAYAFVPDTFFWNADFIYNQVRQDLAGPLAPGNMGSQVTWSTGPELRLNLGSSTEAHLIGHYQGGSFPGSLTDNNTIGGRALLVRRSSPRAQLALGASYDKVSYRDDLTAELFDFDRQEAFARIDSSGPRDNLGVEAGYASVSGGNVDDSGPVFRGAYSRRLTPTLSGYLSYVHEYPTSSAPLFLEDASVPGSGITDESISAVPRVADSFDASLVLHRTRSEARLSYSLRKEESLEQSLGSRNYSELRFFVSRRFTPKASGSFYAARSKETFTVFAEDANETMIGGLLTILFGRSLGLELQVEYRDRDSQDPLESSKEFATGLFLRYSGAFGRNQPLDNGESLGLQ